MPLGQLPFFNAAPTPTTNVSKETWRRRTCFCTMHRKRTRRAAGRILSLARSLSFSVRLSCRRCLFLPACLALSLSLAATPSLEPCVILWDFCRTARAQACALCSALTNSQVPDEALALCVPVRRRTSRKAPVGAQYKYFTITAHGNFPPPPWVHSAATGAHSSSMMNRLNRTRPNAF